MVKILEVTRKDLNVIFRIELSDKEVEYFQFDIIDFNEQKLMYSIEAREKRIGQEQNLIAQYNDLKTKYEDKEVDINATN